MQSLAERTVKTLLRHRHVIDERDDSMLQMHGKNVINFTSNDYLNLANHPLVKKAFSEGAQKYGLGSGSASFISGYYKAHHMLEEAFCDFLNRDKAILFNSGYHANLGIITSLATKKSTIIADKLCHASLIDGMLLSRAKIYRYRHNDLCHAINLINKYKDALVVTESVFSMQGSISDIKSLAATRASLIVDDAHGIGVLGKNGKGICEHQHLTQQDVACLVTPLGKALGSFGAIVSGNTDIIEHILQFSRTYYYTTALPPAVSYATLTSLKLIQEESWRRESLNQLINIFIKGCMERGLKLVSYDATPIKSIIVNSSQHALDIQTHLLKKNIFVSCIRPPTVPVNSSRIRISLNCSHTEAQIMRLLDELYEIKPD